MNNTTHLLMFASALLVAVAAGCVPPPPDDDTTIDASASEAAHFEPGTVLPELPATAGAEIWIELSDYELPSSLGDAIADEGPNVVLSEPGMGPCFERIDEGVTVVECEDAWNYIASLSPGAREREFVQLVDPELFSADPSLRGSCYPAQCINLNPHCSSTPLWRGWYDYWEPPWGGCLGYFSQSCDC